MFRMRVLMNIGDQIKFNFRFGIRCSHVGRLVGLMTMRRRLKLQKESVVVDEESDKAGTQVDDDLRARLCTSKENLHHHHHPNRIQLNSCHPRLDQNMCNILS